MSNKVVRVTCQLPQPSARPQVLASKQKALGGPAPETVKAAQRELAKAQKAAAAQAEAEPEEALEARYGKGNAAASVDRALQSGEGVARGGWRG